MNWREEYSSLGFIVVEGALSHDLIDGHLAEVEALLREYGATDAATFASLAPQADDRLMTAMLYLHRRGDSAGNLLHGPIIRSILRQLFGGEPSLGFARSAFWQPERVRAHVDTIFRSPDPPYSVCRTWCALEDIHPDSGLFYLVPGAHRALAPRLCGELLSERPDLAALFDRLGEEPELWRRLHNQAWPFVSAKVESRVKPHERFAPQLKKGDVVFFNPAIAHGAFASADPRLTRKMMLGEWTVKHPAGAEYFAPLAARAARARLSPARKDNLIDIRPILAARSETR
ncbi:phytanoyl-CoA dioxygenase family protein [Methylocapsa acidiphila]|uniref:phytanoyl-CoA dioxygenase family protein n=1 Tax=Methylocapsa acidiphila TaxID=133552 RepID=UPI00040B1CFC|nr:phytanoyl-CoA dioxygenase family protein [Methylocapsa acidiphila]